MDKKRCVREQERVVDIIQMWTAVGGLGGCFRSRPCVSSQCFGLCSSGGKGIDLRVCIVCMYIYACPHESDMYVHAICMRIYFTLHRVLHYRNNLTQFDITQTRKLTR